MSLAEQKPQFWPTFLAFVTALATLLGAIGGIVATALALTGGGGPASTPGPAPVLASSTPPPAPTSSPTVRPVPPATPRVLELAADADSSWAYPSKLSGDEDHLTLDWSCSRDSRGNGSKQDCGSGVVALRFDLTALPKAAAVQSAVLTLQAEEGGGGTDVYARLATNEWNKDEPPECDASGEAASQADGDQWTWDVTSLLRAQQSAGAKDFGLCLVLKKDASVVFDSRKGDASTAPFLAITYR